MKTIRKIFPCFLLVSLLLISPSGVSGVYAHSILLTPEAEKEAAGSVEQQVPIIIAPLKGRSGLRPVPFDDRDGLNPDEAASAAVIINPALRALRAKKGINTAQLIKANIIQVPHLQYGRGGRGSGAPETTLGREVIDIIADAVKVSSGGGGPVELEAAWGEWQAAVAARLYIMRRAVSLRRLAVLRELKNEYKGYYRGVSRSGRKDENTPVELSRARAGYDGALRVEKSARKEGDKWRVGLDHALGLPTSIDVRIERDLAIKVPKNIPSSKALINGIKERRIDLVALKLGATSPDAGFRTEVRSRFPAVIVTHYLQAGVRPAPVTLAIEFDIPFFKTKHGHKRLWLTTSKVLMDEYTDRLITAKKDIPLMLNALNAVRKELLKVDRAVEKAGKAARRFKKPAKGDTLGLLMRHRAKKEVLILRLVKIRLERRLVDIETALEFISGRYGLFGGGSVR